MLYLTRRRHLREYNQFQVRFIILFGIAHDVVYINVNCVVFAKLGPKIGLALARRFVPGVFVGALVRFAYVGPL